MNDSVTTFLANLRHDIRNNQSVEVGSGIFKGQELVDVANALAAVPDLLAALGLVTRLNCDWSSGSAYVPVAWAAKNVEAIKKARAAIAKATGEGKP